MPSSGRCARSTSCSPFPAPPACTSRAMRRAPSAMRMPSSSISPSIPTSLRRRMAAWRSACRATTPRCSKAPSRKGGMRLAPFPAFRRRPEASRFCHHPGKELFTMKLSHLLIASATAVSFSAIAADEQKAKDKQPQAQSSQSQSASSGQSQETIKQVQEKLSAAGHEVQADGIMGPKTEAALKEFQQSKNLEASGQLDQKT